ncbi:hypothetical protein LV457_10465 [Mycobacterium sp. MYCO198283]|uniref:hypothetical protein n=1 Tax=Mycobacterium sp. MYCO198283 TaxID=2883505 RepID=UPI001E46E38C|nr:hypothetical protein [Mycobacterium sp. MYCO198283]MCG5432709.1 hypothetical protein [Mycobacterium sp. MYCO198283]
MTGAHSDLGPELRALAQAILDTLDPAVRAAAAAAVRGGEGSGRCTQVWCPVCALAALIGGEQHPLLTVVAEHSVTLLAVVRALLDSAGQPPPAATPPPPPGGDPAGPAPEPTPPQRGRYQHIPVTVQE